MIHLDLSTLDVLIFLYVAPICYRAGETSAQIVVRWMLRRR